MSCPLPRLASELALVEADVAARIDDPMAANQHWQIGRDAFYLTLPSGLCFSYRRGRGTTFSRGGEVSNAEVALFFDGSVRGAIAWLNGFVPLHASAVVLDGGVYAFTGVSGEGKSTLVAALERAGFSTFCDDVLVIDPMTIERPVGLPGHKRLKLRHDALALTGHPAIEPVQPGADKFFVQARSTSCVPLPVRRLYMLESVERGEPEIVQVTGGARFAAMREAQYRRRFGTALLDPADYFVSTTRLAEAIAVRRFTRSRDRSAFARGVAAIVADIRDPANRNEVLMS